MRRVGVDVDAERRAELGEPRRAPGLVEPQAARRRRASGSRARSAPGSASSAGRPCRRRSCERDARRDELDGLAVDADRARRRAVSMPERMLISVDLPAPFSPSRQCTSPRAEVEADVVVRDDAGERLRDAPISSTKGGACAPAAASERRSSGRSVTWRSRRAAARACRRSPDAERLALDELVDRALGGRQRDLDRYPR